MTYRETCEYLFTRTPLFSKTGASAYKPGLQTTMALDEHLGHPHRRYRTIHVGGTNGKGSTSHTLAAILQRAGYKVGLFTSPHLIDFRERIRVNGEMCSEEFVVDFVEQHRSFFEPLHPSFFEVTTAMAFSYFAEQEIDVAVIEVGLGGRLDCTNIIQPILSIVTNISLDHTDLLGNTYLEIAHEKAGIIKPHTPFILGERREDIMPVFQEATEKADAPLTLAENYQDAIPQGELMGDCQGANMRTILTATNILRENGFCINDSDVHYAINHVCTLTGLRGRWEKLSDAPLTLCDVGHNPGAWTYLGPRLTQMQEHLQEQGHHLHIVIGMVADKDVDTVLSMLPQGALFYWTQPDSHRAMPASTIAQLAAKHSLAGPVHKSVSGAYQAACKAAKPEDTIFIGGSCYVVADLLAYLTTHNQA